MHGRGRGSLGVGDWARRSPRRGPGRVPGRSGGGVRAGPLHVPSPPRLVCGGGGSGGGGGGSWNRRESSPRGGTRVGIRVCLGTWSWGFGVRLERRGGPWVRWNLHARDEGLQRGGPGGAQGIGAGRRAGAMRRDPDLAGTPWGLHPRRVRLPSLGVGPETPSLPVWSYRPGHLRSLSVWLV